MKSCKVCFQSKDLRAFPQQQMNKDGRGNTCIDCLNAKKKVSPGAIARKMIKVVTTEQKSRQKTAKQMESISRNQEFEKIKREMFNEMFEENGYYFCQHSGIPCYKSELSVHHIVYRSERPNHLEINNRKNLIIVLHCTKFHSGERIKSVHHWFHEKKNRREYLVKERNLEELFGKEISFYQNIQ